MIKEILKSLFISVCLGIFWSGIVILFYPELVIYTFVAVTIACFAVIVVGSTRNIEEN